MTDDENQRIWWHWTDDRGDSAKPPLFARRAWVHGLPRLTLMCRLRGHRPVVAGSERYRYVTCGRCDTRPTYQGNLDRDRWAPGDPYTGAQTSTPPDLRAMKYGDAPRQAEPGPWPSQPRGVVGCEARFLGGYSSIHADLKVGTLGSEHHLATGLALGKLGAIHLHTEGHGKTLIRALEKTRWRQGHDRYESREIGLSIHGGRLWWRLWARRNCSSSTDPKWMQGTIRLDPRDVLLGERRYFHEDIGSPVYTLMRCAHGDDHPITVQLQRWCEGRTKTARRRNHRWSADVRAERAISTRSDNDWKDGLVGWGVDLSGRGRDDGSWVQEAADKAAAFVSADRARSTYRHTTGLPA